MSEWVSKFLYLPCLSFGSLRPKKIRRPRLERPEYVNRHAGRPFLVLGGAPSIRTHRDVIDAFVVDRNPVILSANIPHPLWGVSMGRTQYVGFTNRHRLGQAKVFPSLSSTACLIGPHIPARCIWMPLWERMPFVADPEAPFATMDGIVQCSCHECGWLLIGVASVMGARSIWVAGLDGYQQGGPSHFYEQRDFHLEDALRRQQHIQAELLPQMQAVFSRAGVSGPHFLTPSVYQEA